MFILDIKPYEKTEEVKCPHCKKFNKVKLTRFGYGYCGRCNECPKIICILDEKIEVITP